MLRNIKLCGKLDDTKLNQVILNNKLSDTNLY